MALNVKNRMNRLKRTKRSPANPNKPSANIIPAGGGAWQDRRSPFGMPQAKDISTTGVGRQEWKTTPDLSPARLGYMPIAPVMASPSEPEPLEEDVVPQQLPKESLRRQRSTQPPNVEVGYGMEDTAESESDAKFTDFSKRLAERERLLGRKLNSAEWLEIIRSLQDVANPPPLKRERRYSIPR